LERLVTIVERSISTVPTMSNSWDLSLSIDAHGHDDTAVAVVPGVGSSRAHLKVRAGTVVVHCIDGSSAMSAARAWAAAQLSALEWQPPLRDIRPPAPPAGSRAAYPAGSIIFEGRQPWHVDRVGHALAITVGPLQVRAYDMTALETHIRAWTHAAAVATRVFPGRAVPFARLLEQERHERLRAVDEPIDRRYRRLEGRQPGLPRPDEKGLDPPDRGLPGDGPAR
jgi:hypothetical protein